MLKPALCDYIANLIKRSLAESDRKAMSHLDSVGPIRFDLTPTGQMATTTKRISVVDWQGKAYTITIEENHQQTI